MEAIMDTIVDSLFCFFVTLGTVPIIRCPRGNAAEMVAVKLNKKLQENLRDARNSLFTGDNMASGQFSFHRPLFVLVDRNIDMATPLHHTWTYQALIHDVLVSPWMRHEGPSKRTRNCSGWRCRSLEIPFYSGNFA
uniref:Sec1 family domain containing 1 n=1 Tax=Tetraodon nigroviridis TaxID=99883 RepID=H3C8U3_TETNG